VTLSRWFFVVLLIIGCADGIVLGHPKLRPATLLYPLLVLFAYIYAAAVGKVDRARLDVIILLLCAYIPLLVIATTPLGNGFSSSQGLFVTVLFSSLSTALMASSLINIKDNESRFNTAIIISITVISTFTLLEFSLNNLYYVDINEVIGWVRSDTSSAVERIGSIQFYRAYGLSDEPTVAAFNIICLFMLQQHKVPAMSKFLGVLALGTYFSLLSLIVIFAILLVWMSQTSAKTTLKAMLLATLLASVVFAFDTSLLVKLMDIAESGRVVSYKNLASWPINCLMFGEYSCGPSGELVLGLFGFIVQKFGIVGLLTFLVLVTGVLTISSRKLTKRTVLKVTIVGLFFSANAVLHLPLIWLLLVSNDSTSPNLAKSA